MKKINVIIPLIFTHISLMGCPVQTTETTKIPEPEQECITLEDGHSEDDGHGHTNICPEEKKTEASPSPVASK